MSLLGIDVGSSSCKAVAFTERGTAIAKSSSRYAITTPRPGWAEIDPAVIWKCVCDVTRDIARRTEGNAVHALAVSCHGETVIPVDAHGRPTGNAIMNSDNRAEAQSLRVERHFGRQRLYEITGLPVHPMFSLPKILWWKENDSGLYDRSSRFLTVGGFVLSKMGFAPHADHSLAGRTLAFDIRNRGWSEEILQYAGISADRLGGVSPAGTRVGRLSPDAASELGLESGVTVGVGGHDQPCGALGCGTIDPGQISDSAGSYECLSAVSAIPANSPVSLSYSFNSYCHVAPERFITLAFFPAGLMTAWFLDQFYGEEGRFAIERKGSLFDLAYELAEKACPGPSGICVTPHLVGSCNPHWDPSASAAITGIRQDVTKHHLFKAVIEGISCELLLNIEALQEVTGEFDEITVFGGGVERDFPARLRADISGKVLRRATEEEAVCWGAAMLAGVASEVYRDITDAVGSVERSTQTIAPRPDVSLAYRSQIEAYRRLYPAMRTAEGRGYASDGAD